jgi:rhamnosyltransferase
MISVVMRTFNNIDIIEQSLCALKSQRGIDFELIVFDSGSTDGTLEIVKENSHQLISLPQSEYIPAKVLNEGVSRAKNEIIVLLNSDTVLLTKDSLKNLYESFRMNNFDIGTGRQVARPDAFPEVAADYLKSFPRTGGLPSWISFSAPISILKKSIVMCNPFSSQSWGSEDTELGVRYKKSGFKVGYINSCLAMHSHNYTIKQLFSRCSVEGDADAFIYNNKFSLLKFGFSLMKKIVKFSLVNLKSRSFRFILIQYPIAEVAGYSYGLIVGQKRKQQAGDEVFTRSYQ